MNIIKDWSKQFRITLTLTEEDEFLCVQLFATLKHSQELIYLDSFRDIEAANKYITQFREFQKGAK